MKAKKLERLIGAARVEYLHQVEKIAARLRPRFESGELRGFTDADLQREGEPGSTTWKAPLWRLEAIAGRAFGVTEDNAIAILGVSPSAHGTDFGGWTAHRFHARAALSWDVLRVARARGWTVRGPSETPSNQALGLRKTASRRASVGHGREEGVA